jgi:predicted amidohydrolase YtcJ
MVCRPDQRRRLASLGLFCDIQPAFVPSDMNMAESRLGRERLSWAYGWRSLLDEGLVISASSDAPVESVNPWLSVRHLLDRAGNGGRDVFRPEERFSLEEALPLFTSNPWQAIGRGTFSGRLASGYAADVTVLDRDISGADGSVVGEASPLFVLAGGILSKGELDGVSRFSR